MSKITPNESFETLLILGLAAGAIYYFVIGEPWVALGSLAMMQWIRIY